ncbi:MAG: nucleotidyl transferase AbiEii/AbiGii toxin family protein [Hyphomicrobiaceae bacterium]
MAKEIKNRGASVRARLLKLSQTSGETFELVLVRYALERLLYRLSVSPYAGTFILKGGLLMMTWFDNPHRATRDLDLLGFGDPNPKSLLATFGIILGMSVDDGIVFDGNGLRIDRIREDTGYGGLRLRTTATVGGARVSVTMDIGFGDAVEPGTEIIDYPVLLDLPVPRLRAYARETVIAEKFQAMVVLGRANSRMKDFYDIWILSRSFAFDSDRLARAIHATFARRNTVIPQDPPDALTPAFAADPQKQIQWRAFVANLNVDPGPLADVIEALATFLMPHARAAATPQVGPRDKP